MTSQRTGVLDDARDDSDTHPNHTSPSSPGAEDLFSAAADRDARRKAVQELIGQEELELKTGRLSRAFQLGRLAANGGGRWLAHKARSLVADEASKIEHARKFGVETGLEMLKSLGQMRGAAMKVGQMLSYVDDALPPEAQKILAALQRDAPPMPWETMREQVRSDLGRLPEELFAEFDPTPIAAASIGQVHRARLHDGTPVAVKIQYPGIEDAVQADLKNSSLLGMFNQILGLRTDVRAIIHELEERMLDECNYEKEASYQEEFRQRFSGHPTIVVPEVHREFTGRRVLTTTFYHGRGFYQWLAANPSQEARDRVARTLYRFYQGSIYLDGIYNCDPHPGNYVFLDDGRMVFLDYGCARRFPEERWKLWKQMNRAVARDDADAIKRLAVEIGFFRAGDSYDWPAFREMMRCIYHPYLEDGPFDFRKHRPGTAFNQVFANNPNFRKLNMPADGVFQNRITFGVFSILADVGGELNVHRQAAAYFAGRDPDWTTDPSLVSQGG